jgi:hypothetical protein
MVTTDDHYNNDNTDSNDNDNYPEKGARQIQQDLDRQTQSYAVQASYIPNNQQLSPNDAT